MAWDRLAPLCGSAGSFEHGVVAVIDAQVDHRGAVIGRPVNAPDQRVAVDIQPARRIADRHDLHVAPWLLRAETRPPDALDDGVGHGGAVAVLQAGVLDHLVAVLAAVCWL